MNASYWLLHKYVFLCLVICYWNSLWLSNWLLDRYALLCLIPIGCWNFIKRCHWLLDRYALLCLLPIDCWNLRNVAIGSSTGTPCYACSLLAVCSTHAGLAWWLRPLPIYWPYPGTTTQVRFQHFQNILFLCKTRTEKIKFYLFNLKKSEIFFSSTCIDAFLYGK